MHFFIAFWAILSPGVAVRARAGSIAAGGPCSTSNNHLNPTSFKFTSDCSDQTFCSSAINGTCTPRLCRRDEFPFEFDTDLPVPPLCTPDSFCPDEGSGCEPLVPGGAPCQLNRDDQCAPSYNWRDLASPDNFNGSICLRRVCRYANATLGQACIMDTTTYIDVGPSGELYNVTIARDNCRSPEYYCDGTDLTCRLAKPIGSSCTSDTQCSTRYCDESTCAEPPETPLSVSTWQWIVTMTSIVLAMSSTCTVLVLLDRRHRLQQEKELREYYVDQLSLRRTIIALHTAAAEGYSEKSELSDPTF